MSSWATASLVFGIPVDKSFSFQPPENYDLIEWEDIDEDEKVWVVMGLENSDLYQWKSAGSDHDAIRILCLKTSGFDVSQGELKPFKPDLFVLPEQVEALVTFARRIGLVGKPDWYAFCDYS